MILRRHRRDDVPTLLCECARTNEDGRGIRRRVRETTWKASGRVWTGWHAVRDAYTRLALLAAGGQVFARAGSQCVFLLNYYVISAHRSI